MANKAKPETEVARSKRFKKDAQNLINEGRIDPVDAEALLDAVNRRKPT